jgi:hypothetical protein
MLNEGPIAQSLAELGYLRVKKLIYRASWSSADVEHFVFFTLYGGGNYLAAEFGIRNPDAQCFAVECLQLYGGRLFQNFHVDPLFGCPMRFSLGRMVGWPSRSSLVVSEMSEEALAAKIKDDVRIALFPVVRSVLVSADLFSLLAKDVEPCRWYVVSGAIRAAMLAHLGRQMGMPTSEIEATLQPYMKNIGGSVDCVAPEVFLEKVFRHSN